ncbi:MAG: hypothetical protein R8G66_25985 [Cytophagales bacterium]|nr:hypothetical protein [Cytophagales bacterium]
MAKKRTLLFLIPCLILIHWSWGTSNFISRLDSAKKNDVFLALEMAKSQLVDEGLLSREKAELFYWQGKVQFSELGDKENAIINFYNALKHFRKINDSKKEYASLTYLALSYQSLYHYEYAIDYFNEIVTSVQGLDSLSIIKTFYNLGSTYRLNKEYQKAEESLRICLEYYRRHEIEKKHRNAVLEMGLLFLDQNKLNDSKTYYNASLNMSQSSKDSIFIGRSLNSLGYIHLLEGDISTATNLLLNGLAYKKATDDKRTMITSYLNLGKVYKRSNQLEKAIPMFEIASQLDPAYADTKKIIEALESLSSYYESQSDFEKIAEIKSKIIVFTKPYIELSERLKILHSQYQAERVYQLNENQELQASLAIERQRLIIICLTGLILLIGIIWLAQHYRRLRRVDDDLIIYLKRHVKVLNRIGLRYSIDVDKMIAQVEKEEQARS